MRRVARPPRVASWLITRFVPAVDREAVLGDLEEEWMERRSRARRMAPRLWYWRQVPGCVSHGLVQHWRRRGEFRSTNRREGSMRSTMKDIRYGLRTIRRNPAFALLVAGTLALGIAANAVVFSVVDGVVLNPYPFPEPGTLVGVGTQYPRLNTGLGFFENMSPAEYLDVAGQTASLEHVVSWDMGNRQVTVGDATENLFSGFWWGDAFPTLGMTPYLGRGFTSEEIERGDHVAILSHRVWQDRFGADAALVGGRILMNGDPYTVIGIMPPRALIYGMDLWIPMSVSPTRFPRNRRQFQVLARLKDGATLPQANTELATIAGRVEREYGEQFEEYAGWRMQAMTWNDINVRNLKPAALILLGAVAFVLLLVCANVASLMLARGASRQREIAVRSALGAGRRRILAQLLTESVILALAGGAAGALLGWAGVRAAAAGIATLSLPIPGELGMNARVLGFTGLVSVLAGLIFGVVPALHAARSNPQATLQSESGAVAGSAARLRLLRSLIAVEVALALALVAGSGLMVNSYMRLRSVDPGFDSSNVLTMRLTLAQQRYEPARIEPFFQQLRERVGALPGVITVSTTSQFPPTEFTRRQFRIEGRDVTDDARLPSALTTIVSPRYFETLRIPLLRGRAFTDADRIDAPWVAVLNEAAETRLFDGSAIGQRFRISEDSPWIEIVGVVATTRNVGMGQPGEPEIYGSTVQLGNLNNQMFLVVRTQGQPRGLLPAIRDVVRSIDAEQPVYAIRTIEETVAATQTTERVSMTAITTFGLFALLLAGIGIYGVVAYAVSQRTREIGVRMALGAERTQLRRMVVRQALVPVAIGGTIGLAAAMAIGRLMSGLLFEVSGTDPFVLAGAAGILGVTAFWASWVPARHASRLDPVRALRPD